MKLQWETPDDCHELKMVIVLLQVLDEAKGMTLLRLKSIEAMAGKEITASYLSLNYHIFLI